MMIEIKTDTPVKIKVADYRDLFLEENLVDSISLKKEVGYLKEINSSAEISVLFPWWHSKTCLCFRTCKGDYWRRIDINEKVMKKYFKRPKK